VAPRERDATVGYQGERDVIVRIARTGCRGVRENSSAAQLAVRDETSVVQLVVREGLSVARLAVESLGDADTTDVVGSSALLLAEERDVAGSSVARFARLAEP